METSFTQRGNVWIQDGSILHMYELASLMHFSWCESWTENNSDYGWNLSPIKPVEPTGSSTTGWTSIPGRLKQISVGDLGVWGTNAPDEIWFRSGISDKNPMGTGWTKIDGLLKFISNGAYGIWGVNASDQIWVRNNITVETGIIKNEVY